MVSRSTGATIARSSPATGKDFVFAWKASKFITHWKRLSEKSANSLALMLVKAANRARRGQPLSGDGRLRAKLALPFPLTGAQQRSIREIEGDMAQGAPMLRLR